MAARPRKEVDLSSYAGRFAERLKTLREKKKLTAQEFAEKMGVSDQAVYYWETGRNQPKISDLPKIAETLNLKSIKLLFPDK